jgi:hypothetical protein
LIIGDPFEERLPLEEAGVAGAITSSLAIEAGNFGALKSVYEVGKGR